MPDFEQLKEGPSVISQLRRLRSLQHPSAQIAQLRLQIVGRNSRQRRGINRVSQHNDRCKVRATAPAESLSGSRKIKQRLRTPTNTALCEINSCSVPLGPDNIRVPFTRCALVAHSAFALIGRKAESLQLSGSAGARRIVNCPQRLRPKPLRRSTIMGMVGIVLGASPVDSVWKP